MEISLGHGLGVLTTKEVLHQTFQDSLGSNYKNRFKALIEIIKTVQKVGSTPWTSSTWP